jgi:hypothetical protein
MICVPYRAEVVPLLSCDEPVMTGTVEVRPRIRSVAAPAPSTITTPIVTAAAELKPVMRDADAPAEPDPDPRPQQTGAVELRPVIKKAEED